MKMAPEYGSVITNRATLVSWPFSRIIASPKSTWASPGGCDSGRKDFLVRLLPGSHRVLHHGLAAQITLFIAQPLEDPLGRVSLLLRGLAIVFENLVNDREKRFQLPLRPWLALPVTRWLRVRQDLLQRVPAQTVLPARLTPAEFVRQGPADERLSKTPCRIALRCLPAQRGQIGVEPQSSLLTGLHSCALPN
jgi:hypothetical protein